MLQLGEIQLVTPNIWFQYTKNLNNLLNKKETNPSLPDEALHDLKQMVNVSNHYEVPLAFLQAAQSDIQLSDVAKVAVKSWVLSMILSTNLTETQTEPCYRLDWRTNLNFMRSTKCTIMNYIIIHNIKKKAEWHTMRKVKNNRCGLSLTNDGWISLGE